MGHGLLDIRTEFELVLDIFRREQRPIVQSAHILGPIDDLEMAPFRHVAGIAGKEPPVFKGLGCGFRAFEIAQKKARTLIHYLSGVRYLYLDPRSRGAHGFRVYIPIFLHGYIGTAFCHAIELLQIDPQRPVKLKYLRTDGLPCRISHLDVAHAQIVYQWTVNQDPAQLIKETVPGRDSLIGNPLSLNPAGHLHEVVECLSFYPGRIFYLDHDLGQDILPDAGRRKNMGGPDLPLVMDDCGGAFRAIDRKTGAKGLTIGEDMISDPCHGQIGHDVSRLIQVVPGIKSSATGCNFSVSQHDPFGVARGARRVANKREVIGFHLFDRIREIVGILFAESSTHLLDIRERDEPVMLVFCQPPGIIIDNIFETRHLVFEMHELVSLLLVLGQRKPAL